MKTRNAVLVAALALCASQLFAAHTEVTKAPRLPFLRGMGFDGYYENRNRTWMTQPGVYSGLVNKGFDHVRLPVDFRSYSTYNSSTGVATLKDTTSSWWSSGPGFKTFDTVITNAINAGLYIILDFHGWFDIDPTNTAHTAQFIALWKAVAERYKDYPNQLIFELANEPGSKNFGKVCTMQKNAITEIRKTNPTRLILFDPGDASQPWVLTQCANPPKTSWVSLPSSDNNIAVVVHSYNPGYFTHQGEGWNAGSSTTNVPFSAAYRRELKQDLDWCKAYMDVTGVPLVMNEFNASHAIATHSDVTDYLSMVTRFCESNKVPWAPWIYYANGSGFDCFSGYGANASMIDYVEAGLFPDLKTTDKFSASDYPHKIEITFSGYAGSSTLANFPVLVKLSESLTGFHYSDFKKPNGFDLCFTDSSGNLIPHEIDTWNPSGVSTVWVKVPSLTKTAKIVARYGCAKPIVPKVGNVWDSNYVAVWHMGEPKLPLADSSNVSRDLTAADGAGIEYGVSGVAGRSVDFGSAGGSRGLFADDHMNLDGHAKMTVEAWTYQKSHGSNAGIVSKRKASGNQAAYYLYDNGSTTTFQVSSNGTAAVASGVNLSPVAGRWNHQAYTIDTTASANNAAGYLDGTRVGTATAAVKGPVFAGTGELCIGNLQSGNAANFPGRIDEVRISKCVRSADWVKASYDTVAKASFATYAVDGVVSTSAPEEQGANLVPDDVVEYSALDMDAFAKKVTVTFNGYSGTALANFPVLVKLSTSISGFSYADFQKPKGGDLRFADANGTLLPHEIDTWNTNGVSTVWVKVPSLSANGTITACYGCANPPAVAAKDVWDENYVGVWHLGESALPMKESSKTSTDFTSSNGSGISYAASGIVGGSVDFGASGKSRALLANDHAALDGFTKCTIEAWTYMDANRRSYLGGTQTNDLNKGLIAKRVSASSEASYYLFDTGSATQVYISTNGTKTVNLGSFAVPSGAWTHQVFTFDSTTASGNIGGWTNAVRNLNSSKAITPINAGAANLVLGNLSASDTRNFPGKIDEVRISKVVRSAAWIKATHDTVKNANFATYTMNGNTPQPVVHDPVLVVTVGAGVTNTLSAITNVTAATWITNVVKRGAGTLVASGMPSGYSKRITVEAGVWQGGASTGDFGASGTVIDVKDGASLAIGSANRSQPASNTLSGKTVNLYGAKNSAVLGKIHVYGTNTVALGENVSINLKNADSILYLGYAANIKSGTVNLGGKTLTIQSSWMQIQTGATFTNGGGVKLHNTALYVEGQVPAFSGSGTLESDSTVNLKKKINAPGWTLKTSGSTYGNIQRMPTETDYPGWEGPAQFTGANAKLATYAGSSASISNTVFNLKGAISGSGTLSVGPGWLNLHSANNTYSGAVFVNGQAVGGNARILPGSGGIGLVNGAKCFPSASSITFTNTAGLAFMDATACTVPAVKFAALAGETQSISGGVYTARSTIASITKIGAGTLLIDSPAQVTGLTDIKAGTLKLANRANMQGQTNAEVLAPMPVFSGISFGLGTKFDLSDTMGFQVSNISGSPVVTNAGLFGVTGKWTLVSPDAVLKVTGDNPTLVENNAAGLLAFAQGSTFAFKDAATEKAYSNAVVAAGSAGLVVARARWVMEPGVNLGEVTLGVPQPNSATSKQWEMRVADNNTTVRLFLASASGYAAWVAEKGIAGDPGDKYNGIERGVRYAFDIAPAVSTVGTPIIQVVRDSKGNPVVRSRDLATGRDDVTFGVLATDNLADWSGATLIPMKKFAADGLWKPTASESSTYVFPAKMFFKYTVEVK